MISDLHRCLTVVAVLQFTCLRLVSGVGYWAAESKLSFSHEKEEILEHDENYKISVSSGENVISSTFTESGRYNDIVITVSAFKETFILDLKLNTYLFASTYVERSITNSGIVYHTVNHTENACYYLGSVRGRSRSTAAVSTCTGINGYFAIGNVSYHIEPKSDHLDGPHSVYRTVEGKSKGTYGCGTKSESSKHRRNMAWINQRLKRSFNWPQDGDKRDKVVEFYIANDKSQYVKQGSNVQAVFQRAKNIANIASSAYHPIGIYFVLVGMEVWTDSDRFVIKDSDVDTSLSGWYAYRRQNVNPVHYNDDSILLTNTRFYNGVIGKAIIGAVCSNQFAGAIVSDLNSPAFTASTVAHEIGHTFGLQHDSDSCSCTDKGGHCIMYATANSGTPATNWSSCSVEQMNSGFRQGLDICLYNIPDVVYDANSATCGNGIVENGEQCDCGRAPSVECNSACCNSTTCQLTPSAQCAYGRCCDVAQCQIRSAGYTCRTKAGDCDLAEFCDGTQGTCPADTYKPDGSNCTVNGEFSYCSTGLCRSRQSQCSLVWGSGATESNNVCYHRFNILGLHYGNCGYNWLPNFTYIPCADKDAMCGKLLCNNGANQLSYYQNFYLQSKASIGSWTCNSVIFDFGVKTPDPGMVPDGSSCGDGQMCVSQKCVAISSLSTRPCGEQCQENEVCNNAGFCQSLVGASRPPTSAANVGLIVGLCILFLVIVPLIVLAIVFGYRNRRKIKAWYSNSFPRQWKPNGTTTTIPTVSQTVAGYAQQNPSYHNNEPSRGTPPRPPGFRTQVPSISRGSPAQPPQPTRSAPQAPGSQRPQVTAAWASPTHNNNNLRYYDNQSADFTSLVNVYDEAIDQPNPAPPPPAASGKPAPPKKPKVPKPQPQAAVRPPVPTKPPPHLRNN